VLDVLLVEQLLWLPSDEKTRSRWERRSRGGLHGEYEVECWDPNQQGLFSDSARSNIADLCT
jgi:hypothetical protein